MDQQNQNPHRDGIYDNNQYPPNPHIATFQNSMNTYDQQAHPQLKTPEFSTGFPPQDQQFHQQYQSPGLNERQNEFGLPQQPHQNQINQGYYQPNVYPPQHPSDSQGSSNGYQHQMRYGEAPPSQSSNVPNMNYGGQQQQQHQQPAQSPPVITMEHNQSPIQPPLAQAPSFGNPDFAFGQPSPQQRLPQQQLPNQQQMPIQQQSPSKMPQHQQQLPSHISAPPQHQSHQDMHMNQPSMNQPPMNINQSMNQPMNQNPMHQNVGGNHPQNQVMSQPNDDRVVTTSLYNRMSVPQQSQQQQMSNNNFKMNANPIPQNKPQMSGQQQINTFSRPGLMSGTNPSVNTSLQNYCKHFLEIVKKGDIDQVLQERQNGIDIGTLVDEANYKQTPMFSTSLIPDDSTALRMAKVLKEMGVQPTQPDTLNQTTMYYCCREGKNQLLDFLVENGCNVNHIDTYGQTPIFYAAREGRLETIKKLVSYGGDHDLIDNNGQTPIYYAIKNSKIDVVEYFLQLGVNLEVTDKKGSTPFTFAERQKKQHIIDLLIKYGAQPNKDSSYNKKQKAKPQPPVPQPQKIRVNERKIPKRFQLTVLKNGQYEPLNDEEFEQFKQENPDLAKYFDNPDENVCEELPVPDVPEQAQIYDCWDKAAKRLINTLFKHNQAWIFHEAVDPKKLNIPDYLDIIKQPMDFGTIKQKLQTNQYTKMQDFLHDVQLVFDNCILYNGENSQVSIMCKAVRDEFHKQYQQLFLEFYL